MKKCDDLFKCVRLETAAYLRAVSSGQGIRKKLSAMHWMIQSLFW